MQKKSSELTQQKNELQLDRATIDLIERISKEHCTNPFGYLTSEDLKNEIWVICLERIAKFNGERGHLENFLRTVVKNRLINKFKEITKSVRSPCPKCVYNNDGSCVQFGEDRYKCDKWHNYQLSVESRNSLLNAVEQQIERKTADNSINKMISEEIKALITTNIDKKHLFDFNELISGGKISKQRLKKLKREILRILQENEYEFENTNLIQVTLNGKENKQI